MTADLILILFKMLKKHLISNQNHPWHEKIHTINNVTQILFNCTHERQICVHTKRTFFMWDISITTPSTIATALSSGNMTVGVPAVSTCFLPITLQRTDGVHLMQQTKRWSFCLMMIINGIHRPRSHFCNFWDGPLRALLTPRLPPLNIQSSQPPVKGQWYVGFSNCAMVRI